MSSQWQEKPRPARLERRYEFDQYAQLSEFLDRAAALSEREELYPDISFGRTYVNVTIHADEGTTELADRHRRFAASLDELCPPSSPA